MSAVPQWLCIVAILAATWLRARAWRIARNVGLITALHLAIKLLLLTIKSA
jgi:hypothetical protein